MPHRQKSRKVKNGIYYTPSNLAQHLANQIICFKTLKKFENKRVSIFDPAYGEGALLSAAQDKCRDLGAKYRLLGTDIITPNGHLGHLKYANLTKANFINFSDNLKCEFILMNPPYVRHHRLPKYIKLGFREEVNKLFKLKAFPDLWAYFIIKSLDHLKDGGNIGAILPWSFLQADYAQGVRGWLFDKFESIKILVLRKNHFKDTNERVLFLWLNGFGQKTKFLELGYASSIDESVVYQDLTEGQWKAKKLFFGSANDIQNTLKEYTDKFGFSELKQWADVKIGVVTGANNFFIKTRKEALSCGFTSKQLIPILTNSLEFSSLHFNGYKPPKYLLHLLERVVTKKGTQYLRLGKKNKYHLREHSMRRDPWHAVKVGTPPDAFFPYRVSLIPYMAFNDSSIQSTNSIHRIYFKDVSENQRKWIQLSLLSIPGQLSIEAFGKTYGTGVLKIEPSALFRSIVNVRNKRIPDDVYNKISKLISAGKKREAMELATGYINKEFKIPEELVQKSRLLLNELQSRRK